MSPPVFNNILQIGIVVHDVNVTVQNYRDLLDLNKWHFNYVDTKNGKGRNFRRGDQPVDAKAKIAWMRIGNVELEIIEPWDEDSVYTQFLREKGPGIHHVMFATKDYGNCAERMAANNIAVLGCGELQDTRFQMFDTQKRLGMICEIAEGEPLEPDESIEPR
ncbi:MAG: VOC family protein [Desulfobacterales bacterium]|jgi:4-hydroxyphenylpyruvate dioxygenase-like putative hemolysin